MKKYLSLSIIFGTLLISHSSFAAVNSEENLPQAQESGYQKALFNAQEQFVNKVIDSLFNYDYQNYQDKFKLTSSYFTASGWKNYIHALEKSGNLVALVNMKQTVSGKIVAPIQITQSDDVIMATTLVNVDYKENQKIFIAAKYKVSLAMINTAQGLKVKNIVMQPVN